MVNKNSSILPVFESRTLKNVQYIGAGRYAADAISGVNGILDQYALKCWPNPAANELAHKPRGWLDVSR